MPPLAGAEKPHPLNRDGTHSVAEEIAAEDLNNLYISSCFFKDPEKYSAFCAYYAVMRVVDDRIESCSFDPLAGHHRLSREEKQQVIDEVASRTNGSMDLTPR